MTPAEKKLEKDHSFRKAQSANKLHRQMENEEEKVRTEESEAEEREEDGHHSKDAKQLPVKLAEALERCNQLKKDTYWACDRATCKYHKKCSGKHEKAICKHEKQEKDHKEVMAKHMEVYNKKQEKVKELKKKGFIAAEKAKKKEKVYKSPKAKAER